MNSKGHPFTYVIVHIDVHGVRLLCIIVCLVTAFGELTVEFVYSNWSLMQPDLCVVDAGLLSRMTD